MNKALILLLLVICAIKYGTAFTYRMPAANDANAIQNQLKAKSPHIAIVSSIAEKKSDGSYIFAYETADGSYREEVGIVKNYAMPDEVIEVSGTYRYIDSNGQEVSVTYTAGREGFIVEGTNVAKAITKAAKLGAENARNEEGNDVDDK